MKQINLKALSVLDGRYAKLVEDFQDIFSEYGLIKERVFVEISWLQFIIKDLKLVDFEISDSDIKNIKKISEDFDIKAAERVKTIEAETNHDVKAVEYYIKERLQAAGLVKLKEWVHFGCTSEDINNASYAIMIKKGKDIGKKHLKNLLLRLEELAERYQSVSMLSRTHGQPASPTTIGKEFINFAFKIKKELKILYNIKSNAKFNGASGNYNAHNFVFPNIDWIKASEKFISEYLDVKPAFYTTQINCYNYISETLHSITRAASIIIDIDRDMWGYISFGYFKQKIVKKETGSSTMPHKVNPIDFENSEGNMGICISIAEHLAIKLLNSRFQRDLTDSAALRNIGAIFGYFIIGIKSVLKGLNKIEVNSKIIEDDLNNNMELLAEPIQTAMRVFNEESPYERLKEITRGKKITKQELDSFIDTLEKTPEEFKEKLKALTPASYTGLASGLIDKYFEDKKIRQ
ncbi:MAG: adenylosuccinate lyase [Deltaproteobacteria bacterium]|nr:adenylosuccinate lyase [Deltaproteobacteria bacterium]